MKQVGSRHGKILVAAHLTDHVFPRAPVRQWVVSFPWVVRYLSALSQAADEGHFDPQQLPDDPLALGYLAAALVQIPPDQKQPLLEADQATPLLNHIQTIYRRELPLLQAMIEWETRQTQDGPSFSRN